MTVLRGVGVIEDESFKTSSGRLPIPSIVEPSLPEVGVAEAEAVVWAKTSPTSVQNPARLENIA